MQKRRVISIRMIVTAVAAALITGTVLGVGSFAERNVRKTLTKELQTRLALEARNVAILSSAALLSEYPELTLHPMIKDMQKERPDLSYVYVVDHDGFVKGHADLDRLGEKIELDLSLREMTPVTSLHNGESLLGNDKILLLRAPIVRANGQMVGTAVVGMDRSYIESVLGQARKQQLMFLLPILVAGIIATLVLMSKLLAPITALRDGLERIGRGDLDVRLDTSSRTEFGQLARSVNEMAEELKSAQDNLMEKERLDHEMQLARDIQQSLLPSTNIDAAGYKIVGAQTAAEEVGGDYYDFFPLDDTHMGFVVADVAGKGLGGCLVMSMTAALIRTLCRSHSSPSALLIEMETSLQASLQPGTFVTMFYGILDNENGRLTYASAGHNPILHYKASTGSAEWNATNGVPLGLVPGALKTSLEDQTLVMEPGDVLVQYTDGYSEAADADEQEYGIERMAKRLEKNASHGCHAVLEDLQLSVSNWERGSTAAADDKTLLVVERSAETTSVTVSEDAPSDDMRTLPRLQVLWRNRQKSNLHFAIPATLGALDDIGRMLRKYIYLKDLTDEQFGLLELGLYEVCANIAEHGCKLDSTKIIDVWWIPEGSAGPLAGSASDPNELDINARVSNGFFLIRDYGTPPDLSKWSIPDLGTDVAKRGRGLGLRMIHTIMRDLEVHAGTAVGNVTIMKFAVGNKLKNTREVKQDA